MSLHHFDIVFARREDGIPPRFVRMIESEAHARGMVFVHCQSNDQAEMLRMGLADGVLTIGCLIDYMGRSFPHDYELGSAVKDAGGLVVDDPDRVRIYGNKVVMHHELYRAGISVPRTLIWRAWQPSRDLTLTERDILGHRMICKPAEGSGSGGVVLDFEGTRAALDEVRAYDPDDHYLIQEFVTPLDLDGRPAWFRVYNCFGRVFACFWNPTTHETTAITPAEMSIYGLHDLERISQTIAAISGYTWFSTEIALTERDERRVFLPIDYLNNKCFMLTHSEVGHWGLPDAVATAIAYELVEQVYRHEHTHADERFAESPSYTVYE